MVLVSTEEWISNSVGDDDFLMQEKFIYDMPWLESG